MDIGVMTVAAITALCYVAGGAVKVSSLDNKWIPTIVCCVGIVLGAISFMIEMPDFPADDIVTACAVGAVSGWASTGLDQAIKQLKKGDE